LELKFPFRTDDAFFDPRQAGKTLLAQPVEVVAIGIAAANRQHAGAQDIRDRVRNVRGIAMVGNKSGKRISNCTPTIGQCEQQHDAIRGKSATIERSCDFLARNGWQG
jgi:hypothetical protein